MHWCSHKQPCEVASKIHCDVFLCTSAYLSYWTCMHASFLKGRKSAMTNVPITWPCLIQKHSFSQMADVCSLFILLATLLMILDYVCFSRLSSPLSIFFFFFDKQNMLQGGKLMADTIFKKKLLQYSSYNESQNLILKLFFAITSIFQFGI